MMADPREMPWQEPGTGGSDYLGGPIWGDAMFTQTAERGVRKFEGTVALLNLTEVGSGGVISAGMVCLATTTGGRTLVPCELAQSLNPPVTPFSAAEQVLTIKRDFGLSISEIASVLNVQRPAVYDWLRGTEPQARNADRLLRVYKLARAWSELSDRPMGKAARWVVADERSLLDMLKDDPIDSRAVGEALHPLALRLAQDVDIRRSRSIAKQLKDRGFKPKPPHLRETANRWVPLPGAEGED